MVVNAKCNLCKEPTKYVAGFFDGPRGRHGCLFDCKNEQCEVYQVKRFTESEAVKERIKIQNLNSQKGMYAGYIAALRKDAKITMMKMSQIAGCSPAEYSSYEREKKEFDPEIYRKCEKISEREGRWRAMLTLPIKKKWFDMIASGEKKEEYREIKPYYDSRFMNAFGFSPGWRSDGIWRCSTERNPEAVAGTNSI